METVAVDDERLSVEVSARRADMFMVQAEDECLVRRRKLAVDYLVRGRPQSIESSEAVGWIGMLVPSFWTLLTGGVVPMRELRARGI